MCFYRVSGLGEGGYLVRSITRVISRAAQTVQAQVSMRIPRSSSLHFKDPLVVSPMVPLGVLVSSELYSVVEELVRPWLSVA